MTFRPRAEHDHQGMTDRQYAELCARRERHTWTAADEAALRRKVERLARR